MLHLKQKMLCYVLLDNNIHKTMFPNYEVNGKVLVTHILVCITDIPVREVPRETILGIIVHCEVDSPPPVLPIVGGMRVTFSLPFQLYLERKS